MNGSRKLTANFLSLLGLGLDILNTILNLSGKDDDVARKLFKDICDKLDDLRRAQDAMMHEMRSLFAESQRQQIELYLQSMAVKMKGFLDTLRQRVDEIPGFKSEQGKEENRRGFLSLRDQGEPLAYEIISIGPAAFQGIVIAFGFYRIIFEALQRTAPTRQVRMDYRSAEASALSRFDKALSVFVGPDGDQSVPKNIAEVSAKVAELRKLVDEMPRNPVQRVTDAVGSATRGSEVCTKYVTWERRWTIVGSIEAGWSDTNEVVTIGESLGDCQQREHPFGHGGRDSWLATGEVPLEGEFDNEDAPDAQTEDKVRPFASGVSTEATHGNTIALNQYSQTVRELEAKISYLDGVKTTIDKTLEAVRARRRELPQSENP